MTQEVETPTAMLLTAGGDSRLIDSVEDYIDLHSCAAAVGMCLTLSS